MTLPKRKYWFDEQSKNDARVSLRLLSILTSFGRLLDGKDAECLEHSDANELAEMSTRITEIKKKYKKG